MWSDGLDLGDKTYIILVYVLIWWLGDSEYSLIMCFNDIYGSSMKIGWNVAFQIMCCASGVSSLKIYETLVPGGENIVGQRLCTSILASTRAKGVATPFQ